MVKVDRETLVPIGVAVAVMTVALAAMRWLDGELIALRMKQDANAERVSTKLDALQEALTALRAQVDRAPTRVEINAWVKLFAAKNPNLVAVEFDK
jgi:hypothetical protein